MEVKGNIHINITFHSVFSIAYNGIVHQLSIICINSEPCTLIVRYHVIQSSHRIPWRTIKHTGDTTLVAKNYVAAECDIHIIRVNPTFIAGVVIGDIVAV